MIIKELTLKNFRNYRSLFIEISPGVNFISGPNAAGKTNILEAVSVVSNLKSFRNVPDHEIIQWGESSYFCSVTVGDSAYAKFELGCSNIINTIQKKAKIDGLVRKKISDYYGKFLTVIFSPEDINIINGAPEIRRKFFDSIISKVDTAYLDHLAEFKKILVSRNRLLRDIREKKSKSSGLDIWDEMFSERAALLINKRMEFLRIFNETFKDSISHISEDTDFFYINYNSPSGLMEKTEKKDILDAIFSRREKDIATASTGYGPHRDDYDFIYKDGKMVKNCASQGQKRSSGISLKISECKLIEKLTGEKAVILIDDIFGELDTKRRNKMMDIINENNQMIITAVNPDFIQIDKYPDIWKFTVKPGALVERI